jgi:flagellar protein FliO/FliZ
MARAQEGGGDVSAAGQITDESALLLEEEAAGDASPEISPLTSFGVWDFLRMILVLVMVVGLIYGVFHFIKKAGAPRDSGMRFIRVLETRPLAGNRHLHLVELGNEVLLVGSAENGVSLVAQVSDRETIDSIQLAASRTGPPGGNLTNAIKEFFGRGRTPPGGEGASSEASSTEEEASSLNFMKKQKSRLKKML